MVVLAPMFLWDLYRLRSIHRAYLVYLGAIAALGVPLHLLWDTPIWRGWAMQILGIAGYRTILPRAGMETQGTVIVRRKAVYALLTRHADRGDPPDQEGGVQPCPRTSISPR